MPVPRKNIPYALQSKTERKIHQIINNDKKLSESDLLNVYVTAQVEERIELYRDGAASMSIAELKAEQHDSALLGQYMAAMGDPRPHPLCHAHAMISGGHAKAAVLRLVMAKRGRRIDDFVNGCWLPKNTEAVRKMPGRLNNAVPHSRIHRFQYYRWLSTKINLATIKTTRDLDLALVRSAFALQSGSYPPEIMLSAHTKHGAF
ncbi:AHH domain-containing protein [Agarilytica rhodophyticola]|uniref:AHH domain-containing protein n=1 Tax=Agarilytica rhodophyticola TaxID=1737490 RepID=UPI000B348CC0|nr:AHH domain-containing protein [Agarilytica rhodophyticola]